MRSGDYQSYPPSFSPLPAVPSPYLHQQTSPFTPQMEFNASSMPFWDISQTPMTLSQIADDDFLTLLQKQFPTDVQVPFDLSFPGYNNPTGVNPQSLSDYTIPISQPTSSSSDSSNSPASTINDNDDRSLKRKASDERMDVEPTPKTVHTGTSRPTSYPLPFSWAADT